MAKLHLFQVAVLLHPKNEKKGKTKMLIDPHFLLSKNDKVAAQLAVRSIDNDYADDLDRIEILVRPF